VPGAPVAVAVPVALPRRLAVAYMHCLRALACRPCAKPLRICFCVRPFIIPTLQEQSRKRGKGGQGRGADDQEV